MFTSDCRWQRRLAVRYYVGFLEQNGCAHEKLTFFFMLLYMYIASGRGRQTIGDKIFMSTETSCHFDHLL